MPEGPNPTVYIPSLTGGGKLRACLDALARQTVPARVVLADNGIPRGEVDELSEKYPSTEILSFGENLGFGRALNRAVQEAGDGPVILLNDDVIPRPDFIEIMKRASGIAPMVAGTLTRPGLPVIVDSAGVVVDQTLMAFDYFSGRPLEDLEGAPPPLGPTGGAALYDRELFEAAGGFDERMFLYYEDVDLALRMRGLGASCHLARKALGEHAFSATLGGKSPAKHRRTGWSRGYLLRRYRIARTPRRALQVLLREVPICGAQLILRRSAAGLAGRLDGFRSAGGLQPRQVPAGSTIELSAWKALAIRRQQLR